MRAVCLWSGGKDSCFACYKAKLQGHEIVSLFNFANFNGANSLSHGLTAKIIQTQAEMTGIPFLQKKMPKEGYRDAFKALIAEWKEKKDISGIVFGDIYLEEHKVWIDKVCEELHIEPIMPLWGQDTTEIIKKFVKDEFKAIIVSTQADFLGPEWLGRKIDNELLKQLEAKGNIDFCGEKGEFHTFVYDGPIFKMPVNFTVGKKTLTDKHWFLELIT